MENAMASSESAEYKHIAGWCALNRANNFRLRRDSTRDRHSARRFSTNDDSVFLH